MAGGVAPVVDHLCSKCEALRLNMTTTRKKKKERERKKEKEAIHLSTLGCSLEGWVIGMGTK
jgi:hypothetical protein